VHADIGADMSELASTLLFLDDGTSVLSSPKHLFRLRGSRISMPTADGALSTHRFSNIADGRLDDYGNNPASEIGEPLYVARGGNDNFIAESAQLNCT